MSGLSRRHLQIKGGSEACTACPADSTSASTSNSLESCLCNAGYSGDSITGFVACAAGTYKTATGSQTCASCTGETYSLMGAALCTLCPKNTLIVGDATSMAACQCNKGYAVDVDDNSCVSWGWDTFKEVVGDVACSKCVQGSYQDLTGASTYISCPSDSTSPSVSMKVYA